MNLSNKKIGFVLSGGGLLGSYQLGVIKALQESGIKPNIIVANSIGTVIGAAATYKNADEMIKLWEKTNYEKILGISEKYIRSIENKPFFVLKLWLKFLKSGLTNPNDIIEIYKELIDEKQVLESDIDFGIVTVKLPKFELKKIFKKDMIQGKLHEYILANQYLPFIKPKKVIDNSFYLDGGMKDFLPVDMLKNESCDLIFCIDTGAWAPKKAKINVFSKKTILIKPTENLGSIIDLSKSQMERRIKLGYSDGVNAVKNI